MYIRALRLPFITASVIPFVLGSFINKSSFSLTRFIPGLICVILTHLGANLINDYADSRSGADWQDRKFYKFFGGSKLIQEGILSEKFYLRLAILCFIIAFGCIVLLAFLLGSISILVYYLIILGLSFFYSQKPLRFSYRGFGEVIIFILFGPALVMGGYFIQTRIFPEFRSFMLSLPLGFFTTAILYSNEIPDFLDDMKAGKRTWVSLIGQGKGFILYCLLAFLGFIFIVLNTILGYLSPWSLLSFALIPLVFKAINILKSYYYAKIKLIESSRLTITVHALVGMVLILDVLL